MRVEGSFVLRRFRDGKLPLERRKRDVRPIERRRFDRRTRNLRFARRGGLRRTDLSRHGATLNVLRRTRAQQIRFRSSGDGRWTRGNRFRFRFVVQVNRHRRRLENPFFLIEQKSLSLQLRKATKQREKSSFRVSSRNFVKLSLNATADERCSNTNRLTRRRVSRSISDESERSSHLDRVRWQIAVFFVILYVRFHHLFSEIFVAHRNRNLRRSEHVVLQKKSIGEDVSLRSRRRTVSSLSHLPKLVNVRLFSRCFELGECSRFLG